MTESRCILCGWEAKSQYDESHMLRFDCRRCGQFRLGAELSLIYMGHRGSIVPGLDNAYLVSGFVREAREINARKPPDEWERPVINNVEEFERIAKLAPRDIHARLFKLLRAFARKPRKFGQPFKIEAERDYPLGYAVDEHEFGALVDLLDEQGWIKREVGWPTFEVTVTFSGIQALEAIGAEFDGLVQGFVAMWFHEETQAAFVEAIEPAVRASGWAPQRIDLKQFNGDVVDEVLAEIRRSRFIVADLTGSRGGVYFEAGFALGLARDVIFTCRADEIGKVHFDVRNFSAILWAPDELVKFHDRLRNRIEATIGLGPVREME
jgi:hypothetical protein